MSAITWAKAKLGQKQAAPTAPPQALMVEGGDGGKAAAEAALRAEYASARVRAKTASRVADAHRIVDHVMHDKHLTAATENQTAAAAARAAHQYELSAEHDKAAESHLKKVASVKSHFGKGGVEG